MTKVMVLNGENRGALALIRSLGKNGFTIYVGGSRRLSRGCYSKYVHKRFFYPSVFYGEEKMHSVILKYVKSLQPDVLVPFSSDTAYVILKHKRTYENYCKLIPFNDFNKYKKFHDKKSMIEEAKKVGCPVPETHFIKKSDNLKKIATQIHYPVLIKPRIASGGKGIKYINSPEELKEKFHSLNLENGNHITYLPHMPYIQQYIKGNETYTVYVLFNKGKHVASVVGQNFKHYPIPYGPPLLSRTVKNEKIRNLAIDVFSRLNWHGAANVHFKIDPEDNIPKMLEINPRIWATIESSIKAGVDFPLKLIQLAKGQEVSEQRRYKSGMRFRWILFGEFFHLLKTPQKKKYLREFFNFKKVRTEIDIRDPFPHFIHGLDLLINQQVL